MASVMTSVITIVIVIAITTGATIVIITIVITVVVTIVDPIAVTIDITVVGNITIAILHNKSMAMEPGGRPVGLGDQANALWHSPVPQPPWP